MSFPFDLFQKGFAGGCAEVGIAGGGLATSTGDKSVELEDLLVNPTVNRWSKPFWYFCYHFFRSWSPTTGDRLRSPRALEGLCFALDVLPDEIWLLSWMPFLRVTVLFSQFTQRECRGWFLILSTMDLNKHVQTSDINCCFFSRMSSSISSDDWWILRLLILSSFFRSQNHFYSSYEVKLPSTQWNSLSFRRCCRRWINTLRGTRFEELLSILKIWTWNFLHVLV